jgi:threonine dehydratase
LAISAQPRGGRRRPPLAAALQERDWLRGKKIGLVVFSGNIDFELFQRWIAAAGKNFR